MIQQSNEKKTFTQYEKTPTRPLKSLPCNYPHGAAGLSKVKF